MTIEYQHGSMEFSPQNAPKTLGVPVTGERMPVTDNNDPVQSEIPSDNGDVLAATRSYIEELRQRRPDSEHWDRIEAALKVMQGEKVAKVPKPPEPEPTDSQKFWRKMFDTENSPYSKTYRPMRSDAWNALKDEAAHDPLSAIKNIGSHIHAIDIDIRGGRDPGDAKERLQRVATMMGVFALFTAFDAGTSRPIHWVQKKIFPKIGTDPTSKRNAGIDLFMKLFEVLNDKLATAFGDKWVSDLTGKKVSFTTEPTDKLADVGNVAFEDTLEDLVNGPTLEATARALYQIPIFGAFFEQGVAAIERWQGKDGVNKGIGKAMFMAWAKYLYQRRGLGVKDTPIKLVASPPSEIAMPENYEAL
jgi:hypothetical protein